MLIVRACLVAFLLITASCSSEGRRQGESATFYRYWVANEEYLEALRKFPEHAGEEEKARRLLASLSESQIGRIVQNNIPPFVAAQSELQARVSWSAEGVDWTRYLVHYDLRQHEQSAAEHDRAERVCADMRIMIVKGHVARSGRQVRKLPGSIIGVVPVGLDQYAGVLVAETGRRIPVTWVRQWSVDPGNPRLLDPVDAESHTYQLQRLAGGRYWSIIHWAGRPMNKGAFLLTRENCVAALESESNGGPEPIMSLERLSDPI